MIYYTHKKWGKKMGWNGSDITSSKGQKTRTNSRTNSSCPSGVRNGLVAFVLVALVGGAAWWFLSTPMSQPTPVPEEEETPAAHDGDSSATTAEMPRLSQGETATAVKPTTPPKVRDRATKSESSEKPAAAEEVRKPKEWKRDPNCFYLDSASDQMIALLFMHDGGDQPPLPDNAVSDKEFLKSLETPIVIKESDDERTKLLKNTLIEIRAEIKKRLDAGESVNSILHSHQEEYNFNERTRIQAAREARAIYETGDIEGVAEYVETINKALEQMGIAPIEDPRAPEEIELDATDRRFTEHDNDNPEKQNEEGKDMPDEEQESND